MYVEGVERNKKIFKQIYKVTLFVMSKELKVVYTYMNRMLTVATLCNSKK